MTSTPEHPDAPGTAAPQKGSRRVQNAVNKTIRELTRVGELPSSRAAHVELVKLTARRLDRAEDADDGAQVVKLTVQLRGLLAELEPRRGRGDGSSNTDAGAAVGGGAPADLDGLLRAGPTLGDTA